MEKRKPKLPALNRLVRDMSSAAYHGVEGTWSSSQLKDLLEDEEIFIQKYIKKSVEKLEIEAFDTGTYFHTGVLEPGKVSKEIVVYSGKVRSGKVWEEFKTKHTGKTIITSKQKEVGDGMIRAVKNSPVSQEYIIGEPEVSLFVEIQVIGGEIYAPSFKKRLTLEGWIVCEKIKSSAKAFNLILKVRADCLGKNFISDLKSTSGNATQSKSVRDTISKYKYDLSASLYLDIFSLIREELSAFIWIFSSKVNPVAKSWLASPNQILVGRAKWMAAVKKLSELSCSNWELPDFLGDVEPLPHEMEWLRVRDHELL